jgi:hypothetical protein
VTRLNDDGRDLRHAVLDAVVLAFSVTLLFVAVTMNVLYSGGSLGATSAAGAGQIATTNYVLMVVMMLTCVDVLRRFFSEETTLHRRVPALLCALSLFTAALMLVYVAEHLDPARSYPHKVFS